MIRRLRQRHRVMSGGLLLAVIGSGIALISRPTDAVMEQLPSPLTEAAASAAQPLKSGDDLWDGAQLRTTIYPDQVVISPLQPLRHPDCLLYWTPMANREGELPKVARLLGAVAEQPVQRIPVPASLTMSTGHLLIYSLGHSEVIAWLSLAPEATP